MFAGGGFGCTSYTCVARDAPAFALFRVMAKHALESEVFPASGVGTPHLGCVGPTIRVGVRPDCESCGIPRRLCCWRSLVQAREREGTAQEVGSLHPEGRASGQDLARFFSALLPCAPGQPASRASLRNLPGPRQGALRAQGPRPWDGQGYVCRTQSGTRGGGRCRSCRRPPGWEQSLFAQTLAEQALLAEVSILDCVSPCDGGALLKPIGGGWRGAASGVGVARRDVSASRLIPSVVRAVVQGGDVDSFGGGRAPRDARARQARGGLSGVSASGAPPPVQQTAAAAVWHTLQKSGSRPCSCRSQACSVLGAIVYAQVDEILSNAQELNLPQSERSRRWSGTAIGSPVERMPFGEEMQGCIAA